ncbi:MAG TPA: non-ribosomal peptide synthase [Acidobacteria bacterium]|nr:non-ribosomal peptide synthase [Acidobacteriota bacterium]
MKPPSQAAERFKDSDVAVIGLAGRFPGAPDAAELWRNLRAGRKSIKHFTDEELADSGIDPGLLGRPDYVKAFGVLDGIELFDAGLFGLSPREAEITDPQLRLFLECALEALENAGHAAVNASDLIGVYAGATHSSYLWNLLRQPALLSTFGFTRLLLGNDKDYLATWTSYKLNLRGPSLSVQTACSTSLVAVHLACQALANGECDIALAGGVSVNAQQVSGYLYREDGILSPDGHCRPFDAQAQGTVGGSGVGIVVLRRLADALEDGDAIRAVIKGTATNNDGSLKVGYTAPSVDGQARAIHEAIAVAEIDPESLDYIEAHGTATALGDPVEMAALNRALGRRTRPCLLGAVKSNLGHLDAAAGVTGLIKTVLALEHGEIPATLHFRNPNPQIQFGSFRVVAELTAWPRTDHPRRAGVSSFGIGGTNAHAVLEEAPEQEPSGPARPWQILTLSAKTADALESAIADLARHLSALPGPEPNDFADVAYTLQVGRRHLPHRRVVVCRDALEAIASLSGLDPQRAAAAVCEMRHRPVFFLFPGQGSQHVGMTGELYASEPGFRRRIDASAEILRGILGFDLRRVLYPPASESEAAELRLRDTAITQPALFVVEHALAGLWMEWGVRPRGMLGHSLGEYVAACLAGVLTLPDALRLVVARGRLMSEMPPGSMLSVPRPVDEIARFLTEDVSLSAINAPGRCTVSGPPEDIGELARLLAEQGIESRTLRTSHAFHSRLMEPAAERFAHEVAAVSRQAPKLRYIANLTGTWVRDNEVADPAFWARQLREPVLFAAGVGELLREEAPILLEVGPGAALTAFARRQIGSSPAAHALASLPRSEESGSEVQALLGTAGRLWLHGVEIDWRGFHAEERRRRVPLPTYPFERRRYWIAPPSSQDLATAPAPPAARLPREWLYTPIWRRLAASPPGLTAPAAVAERWILFDDGGRIAAGLRAKLEGQGVEVLRIERGDGCRAEGIARLLARSEVAPQTPLAVVHLWSAVAAGAASLAELQECGYYSLLDLARALEAQRVSAPVTVWVITSGVHEVTGEEMLAPARATVLGPCRVIPQEMPNVRCRHVDIMAPAPDSSEEERVIDRLAAELASPEGPPVVACRGAFRWVPEMARLPSQGEAGAGSRLRPCGVYLITGGLGKVGLALARHLAAAVRARLVLTGRSPFPARDRWDGPDHDSEVQGKIRALREIEALGGEILFAEADVADEEAMARVVREAEEKFGPLNGVLHAAGQAGLRAYHSLSETGSAESREQFRAKVDGTLALERALTGRKLDFCVLISSLSAILGGLGFAAYSAANLFLDAFAAERNRTSPFPWITIDWDGWRFDGDTGGGVAAVTPEAGGFILDRALAMEGVRQIVVSVSDLGERMRRWIERPRTSAGDPQGELAPDLHPRPDSLATAYAEPVSESEERLAELWRELLGIDRVGLHDNFFELGGDSLLATQLFSRVRQEMGAGVPLRTIFEAPTVAGLAAIIDREAAAAAPRAVLPVLRVSRDLDLPLSFAQRRLWFLHQLDPQSPAYNIHVPFRLQGRLSLAAFAAALSELVRRHEVLRSTFRMGPQGPVQILHPPTPLPVPVIDLAALPARRREAELLRLCHDESCRPFDLAMGPLLRMLVVRLGDADQAILAPKHHIVTDLWSEWLFVREITVLYDAFSAGRPSPMPDLPVQYADFAWWQHEWLRNGTLNPALDYWRARLVGAPPLVELPTDRPRPAVQTHNGASRRFLLPARLAMSLAELGRKAGATSFMVLLAGFSALASRLAGATDLPIGTPIANRNRLETEGLIGFFVNTLVLRNDLSGEPSFAELLLRTRSTTLAAYSYQDLPFEKLVEILDPQRTLAHTPLFQMMFGYYNAPPRAAAQESRAFTVSALAVVAAGARFDVELQLADRGDGISGDLVYNRDLFDASTIQRLTEHFAVILEEASETPARRLSELPLLGAGARQQLLLEWNDTETTCPGGLCLHALVAAQAERAPDAIAASFEGECLTYRELVRRARRLSRYLRALGTGPDDLVGVLLERSLEMIVALLGVMEAGAAYVPLDPGLPAERLGVLVESAGLAVILTRERHSDLMPFRGERAVPLDTGWSEIEGLSGEVPPARVEEQNLAYVLYTSGSTGTPKGVMISHQGIVNRLLWMQEAYGLTAQDRVLQKTPFGFDVSLWEFFWPLLTGARLVFAQPEGHKDPQYLVDLIAREGVTTLHFVPSMLEAFMEAQGLASLTALRRVMASGEALPLQFVRRFFARLGHAELHNLYGPTEASVDVSAWPCVPDPPGSLVPIGRPIANHRLHVVDGHLALQPAGVPGELLLGGPGLARGYLGRPDLTAEVFVPDPLGGVPGGRLYRTGDLVRHRADGELEFLGRTDHQVKLRGFRIELGEIEAVLTSHPAVREAVVLLRTDLPGGGGLVAYVVTDGPEEETVRQRRWLEERLPGYMVPAAFVRLESLPRTINGKVDRRALATPQRSAENVFVAPRAPVEIVLAQILAELLAVPRVGVDDNFFQLGGHSLLATQVITRVSDAFGVSLQLRHFLEAPTIRGLAARILADARELERVERIAALMVELAELSDAEVEAMLDSESSTYPGGSRP